MLRYGQCTSMCLRAVHAGLMLLVQEIAHSETEKKRKAAPRLLVGAASGSRSEAPLAWAQRVSQLSRQRYCYLRNRVNIAMVGTA